MSLAQNATFESTLEDELKGAGLHFTPQEIVGRCYRFGCEHGSHHHILFGTIQAIEISDEGGFNLCVSNPRLWGMPLISLKYNNGGWGAYIIPQTVEHRFFSGEFVLL